MPDVTMIALDLLGMVPPKSAGSAEVKIVLPTAADPTFMPSSAMLPP
jgi:hypothetical protein